MLVDVLCMGTPAPRRNRGWSVVLSLVALAAWVPHAEADAVALPRERPAEFAPVAARLTASAVAPEAGEGATAGSLPEAGGAPAGVPVPLPRPADLSGPAPPAPEAAGPEVVVCLDELTRAGVKAEAVAPPAAQGACGIDHPVRLTALPGGVALKPAAIVNCAVARALVSFIGEDVAAAARERLAGRVAAVAVATSYDCRPQNHVGGAKMSEHGVGNAVDLSSFVLDGGKTVTVGDPKADAAAVSFVADIRKASCARFTTVLGPGSDSEHGNHLHLDLRQRSNGYRICQ